MLLLLEEVGSGKGVCEASHSASCGSAQPLPSLPVPPAGNAGGEAEDEAVGRAAARIESSCQGFADFLAAVAQQLPAQAGPGEGADATADAGDSSRLGARLQAAIRGMEAMEWLVPPMLQPR